MSRDDQELGEPRQLSDDVLGDAITEILLLRVAAEIGERQHRNGGPVTPPAPWSVPSPPWGGVGGGGRAVGHLCAQSPRPPPPTLPHKGGGSRRRCARSNAQNRCREPVATARYGLDDGLVAIANGLAHFAHAMRQRFVGYGDIRPDRLEQLLLGHQA